MSKKHFKTAIWLIAALAMGPIALMADPAPDAAPTTPSSDLLPIRAVMLFTSGVGYFQRDGQITGSCTVPLSFRSIHVDDILKSLILMDPKGHVEPVTYTSQEPIEQALKAFGINVSQNLSMADLLAQLRGVEVQVTVKNSPEMTAGSLGYAGLGGGGSSQYGPSFRNGPPDPGMIINHNPPETITGQVMSTETQTIRRDPEDDRSPVQQVLVLNLVTDTGIRSISMKNVTDLKIMDPTLAAQLKQALSTLATGHDSQQKTITLHFGDGPTREVTAGYVTEAPVWKTSYRLSLDDKPYMQGWAIVDNSTEHDWNNIQLTLVSGQPISFIEDLYTPLYIPRPVVAPEVQANPYPQLSEENVMQNAKDSMANSAGRAMNHLRAANAPMAAQAMLPGGMGGGSNGEVQFGAETAMTPPSFTPNSGVSAQATGQKAGEMFEYRIANTVSIPRQQSAMIPIVSENVTAEKVDVYNYDVDATNPLNGLRLTNSTDLHLKAGPVTIFDAGAYAGDARMPELEPKETRLLTYAVDLGITANKEVPAGSTKIGSISIHQGVLIITWKTEYPTRYTFKNKLDTDRTVIIEQPIRQDYTLVDPVKPDEKTKDFYRFRVTVPAGQSVNFKTLESHIESQTMGLLDTDANTILQYRSNGVASPALQAALSDIASRKQKIAQIQTQLNGQQARLTTITSEQSRIRQNMAQLDQTSALYKRYVGELNDQETLLANIRDNIDHLQTDLTQAQTDLNNTVSKLDVQ